MILILPFSSIILLVYLWIFSLLTYSVRNCFFPKCLFFKIQYYSWVLYHCQAIQFFLKMCIGNQPIWLYFKEIQDFWLLYCFWWKLAQLYIPISDISVTYFGWVSLWLSRHVLFASTLQHHCHRINHTMLFCSCTLACKEIIDQEKFSGVLFYHISGSFWL